MYQEHRTLWRPQYVCSAHRLLTYTSQIDAWPFAALVPGALDLVGARGNTPYNT